MKWKIGDEFAPYHPSASHCPPDYRDGWNHCYAASESAQSLKDRTVRAMLTHYEKWGDTEGFGQMVQAVKELFYPEAVVHDTVAQGMEAAAAGETFLVRGGSIARQIRGDGAQGSCKDCGTGIPAKRVELLGDSAMCDACEEQFQAWRRAGKPEPQEQRIAKAQADIASWPPATLDSMPLQDGIDCKTPRGERKERKG